MNKDQMLEALQKEVAGFNKIIATEKGDWIVKGFIDISVRKTMILVMMCRCMSSRRANKNKKTVLTDLG